MRMAEPPSSACVSRNVHTPIFMDQAGETVGARNLERPDRRG